MNQVLDEERVERACAKFFGDALWEKFGQTAKSRGRRNIGAAISAYLGETSGWQTIETAPKDRPIMYHNGKMTDAIIGYCRWSVFAEDDMEAWWDYERDDEAYPKFWMPVIPLPSPPFNVNTGDSEETPLAMRDRK